MFPVSTFHQIAQLSKYILKSFRCRSSGGAHLEYTTFFFWKPSQEWKEAPLATHHYLVWAYRAKCALAYSSAPLPPPSLQVWPWNCIAAVGKAPPLSRPSLSSSRSQIKAYQMEEEKGELQFATRPSSPAHTCLPCKNAHFPYQKRKVRGNTRLGVSCFQPKLSWDNNVHAYFHDKHLVRIGPILFYSAMDHDG